MQLATEPEHFAVSLLRHSSTGDRLIAIYENGDVYKFDIVNDSYQTPVKCKHEKCIRWPGDL